MVNRLALAAVVATVATTTTLAACTAAPPPLMDPIQQHAAADPAVDALRAGDFATAAAASGRALRDHRGNALAAAVHALAAYQSAGQRLRDELAAVLEASEDTRKLDHRRARTAWNEFASALAGVEADLAIAATDPGFALELCLACWEHDWNHSGEVDDGDRRLFQIEVDTAGAELPEADPRRTPTFRFDAGDIAWARAMIAFQRAVSELVLAYKWDQLDYLFAMKLEQKLTIRLDDAGRVRKARDLIRAGLGFSDQSRSLYLAETDDDREWVPSPRQHDHPVPLAMDAALYDTWAAVTRDVRAIIDGREGIDLTEVMGPRYGLAGFLDVGELLAHPRDITIDLARLWNAGDDDALGLVLRDVLGPALVDQMPRSPLVGRILRMAGEIDRDEDTFGRKLRYLLWIN